MGYLFLFLQSLAILLAGSALWESVSSSTWLSHSVTLVTFFAVFWLWRRYAR